MGFFQVSTKSRPVKFTLSNQDHMCFGSARLQFNRAVWKASTTALNNEVERYHRGLAEEAKRAESDNLYRLFVEHGYSEPKR